MDYRAEYKRWLESDSLSQADKDELLGISGDDKEIESRFCGYLTFGTAGLRGTMGMGINRMNIYVIRHTTQAFAQVVLEEGGVAGAAREALNQVTPKALGMSVGGKIGIARSGEHVAVAVFFNIGLGHLDEVCVGLGHRAI